MANNAIALGIRAPQSGVNSMVQQNANLINQMTQAAAQQRQAAQLQQKMQFDAAQEARQAKTGDVEYATKVYEFHRMQAPAVQNAQTYSLWLQGVAKDSPETAAMFTQSLPPAQFDPSKFNMMLGKMDDVFGARFGKATTSTQVTPEGGVMSVNTSSIPGASFAQQTPDITSSIKPTNTMASSPAPTANAMAPSRGATIQSQGDAATAAAPILSAAQQSKTITPEDAARVKSSLGPNGATAFDAWTQKNGITVKPISFSPDQSIAPEMMPQIIDAAVRSGSIDETHLQQLRKIIGPENDEGLAAFLKKNNVQIQLSNAPRGEQMPAGYGGLSMDGANEIPFRQDIQYAPSAFTQARVKPPIISPQANPAPSPVVQANAAAEEAGKGRTARLEKLRSELPQARAAAQATISAFDQQINTIDEFLRHPYRNSIVGAIEGRLPSFLQDEDRADVQAKWDRVRNGQVIQQIIDDRQKTGTGASPLGNMSNSDLNIYMKAGSALTQTGNERTQEIEMMKTRDKLMEGRNRAIQVFNDAFHEVANTQALLNPPPIARKYSPGTPAPSPQDIATLRRNRNNSQFTDGFKRHFGVQAFNAAMGGQ